MTYNSSFNSNYPPGVNGGNFDELCWGETYRKDRRCMCCKDTIADEWPSDLCESCEEDEEMEEQEDEG